MKSLFFPVLALVSSLTGVSASAQLVPPGASGSTTTSAYTQSVTRTSATTSNFSRDQTFVISGSNVSLSGSITAKGGTLGGVTSVTNSPIDNKQLFPSITTRATSSGLATDNLKSRFGEAKISSASSRNDITLTSSDNTVVTSLVLNPNLDVTARTAGEDFDLALTQSTPGLTSVDRTETGTTSSQVQTSLSVFTAPFIP